MLVALVLILFTDQLTSSVLKPVVARLRPCSNAYGVREVHMPMLVECGSGFSMPSSHAANHFAIAVFVGLLFYRNSRFLIVALLLWAALVSVAQVYVGVHFPLDGNSFGAFLGSYTGNCRGNSPADLFCHRSFYVALMFTLPERSGDENAVLTFPIILPFDKNSEKNSR